MEDTDYLILEISKRPALYDKSRKDYTDRKVKDKLWLEVFEILIENWDYLTPSEQEIKGNEIKKKWKNIRDCFSRELAAQKKVQSGPPFKKKRRKYIYFDSLLFLLPSMQNQETSGAIPSPAATSESQIEELDTSTPPVPNVVLERQNTATRFKRVSSNESYEEKLINILQQKNNEEFDEDKSFSMMLVPMLRKLDDDQKHFAKTEILNVMNRARRYNAQQYTEPPHRYPNYFSAGTATASNLSNQQ